MLSLFFITEENQPIIILDKKKITQKQTGKQKQQQHTHTHKSVTILSNIFYYKEVVKNVA